MIKKYNFIENTGNPVFIEDLTEMNQMMLMLKAALDTQKREIYMVSGFDYVSGGSNYFTPGIIWYKGNLYEVSEEITAIPLNSYLYVNTEEIDQRVAEDNTLYYAYTRYYVTFDATSTNTNKGTLIDPRPLTQLVVREFKKPPIANGTIVGEQIANLTIENQNIAPNSIHDANIIPYTLTNRALANSTINSRVLGTNVVMPENLSNMFLQSRYQLVMCRYVVTRPTTGNSLVSSLEWTSTKQNNVSILFVPNPNFNKILFEITFKGSIINTNSVVVSKTYVTNMTNNSFDVFGPSLDSLPSSNKGQVIFNDPGFLEANKSFSLNFIFVTNNFDI